MCKISVGLTVAAMFSKAEEGGAGGKRKAKTILKAKDPARARCLCCLGFLVSLELRVEGSGVRGQGSGVRGQGSGVRPGPS